MTRACRRFLFAVMLAGSAFAVPTLALAQSKTGLSVAEYKTFYDVYSKILADAGSFIPSAGSDIGHGARTQARETEFNKFYREDLRKIAKNEGWDNGKFLRMKRELDWWLGRNLRPAWPKDDSGGGGGGGGGGEIGRASCRERVFKDV